jgi:hypothetical protein
MFFLLSINVVFLKPISTQSQFMFKVLKNSHLKMVSPSVIFGEKLVIVERRWFPLYPKSIMEASPVSNF